MKTLKKLNSIWKEELCFWKNKKLHTQTKSDCIINSYYRIINGQLERRVFTVNVDDLSVGDSENYISMYVQKLRYNNKLRNRSVHIPKTEEEKN